MTRLKARLKRLEERAGLDGELTVIILQYGYMPEACYDAWIEAEERKHRGGGMIILETPAPGEPCPVCGQVHETVEQYAERGQKVQEQARKRFEQHMERGAGE